LCVRTAYPPGLVYDPNMFDQARPLKINLATNLGTTKRAYEAPPVRIDVNSIKGQAYELIRLQPH
jgi:hypothetical protein